MKKFLNIFPRLRTIALARFSVLFPLQKRLKETRATSKMKDDLVRGSWQVNVAFTILFSSSFLELILVNDQPEMDYFQGSNFCLKYLLHH